MRLSCSFDRPDIAEQLPAEFKDLILKAKLANAQKGQQADKPGRVTGGQFIHEMKKQKPKVYLKIVTLLDRKPNDFRSFEVYAGVEDSTDAIHFLHKWSTKGTDTLENLISFASELERGDIVLELKQFL